MKLMKNTFLYCALIVLLSTPVFSKTFVDVYVRNATESPLLMPEGNSVQAGETTLFRKIKMPERWNDVFVTGLIQSESRSSITPCQVSFRTYKDLNFHHHIMKTVIFVRQKGNRLVCSPRAVEFDKGGFIRAGGLRLSLKTAYQKVQRSGEIRPGKPHLVYEYEKPLIPYLYVSPKAEKVKGRSTLRQGKVVRKRIIIAR